MLFASVLSVSLQSICLPDTTLVWRGTYTAFSVSLAVASLLQSIPFRGTTPAATRIPTTSILLLFGPTIFTRDVESWEATHTSACRWPPFYSSVLIACQRAHGNLDKTVRTQPQFLGLMKPSRTASSGYFLTKRLSISKYMFQQFSHCCRYSGCFGHPGRGSRRRLFSFFRIAVCSISKNDRNAFSRKHPCAVGYGIGDYSISVKPSVPPPFYSNLAFVFALLCPTTGNRRQGLLHHIEISILFIGLVFQHHNCARNSRKVRNIMHLRFIEGPIKKRHY
jgi:hypothetical protein